MSKLGALEGGPARIYLDPEYPGDPYSGRRGWREDGRNGGTEYVRADIANAHVCEHWRAEGVGCRECNPIAQAVAADLAGPHHALRRIAGLGMDCPPAMDRADFYRDQLMSAIGLAARTIYAGHRADTGANAGPYRVDEPTPDSGVDMGEGPSVLDADNRFVCEAADMATARAIVAALNVSIARAPNY